MQEAEAIDAAVGAGLDLGTAVALAGAVVVGLILLLIGRRLAGVACGLMGLVLGAAAGLAGTLVIGSTQWATLAVVAIAGVIGVAVAALLFRVWAAISSGVVLGVSAAVAGAWLMGAGVVGVPGGSGADGDAAAGLVAEGSEQSVLGGVLGDAVPSEAETRDRLKEAAGNVFDRLRDSAQERIDDLADRAGDAITDRIEGVGDEGALDGAEPVAEAVIDDEVEPGDGVPGGERLAEVRGELVTALDDLRVAAWEWLGGLWSGLDGRARIAAVGAGVVVGGVALVMGVVLPTQAATVAAAWLGACVVWLAGRTLLTGVSGDAAGWLPSGPAAQLAVMGLITAAGLAVQWTLLRPKTDD